MPRSSKAPATRKRTRSQNEDEPSSTAKKRRLNVSDEAPAPAAGVDEASEMVATTNRPLKRGSRVAAAKPVKKPSADSWEVQNSEHEGTKPPKESAQQTKGKKAQPKKSEATTSRQMSSVYDVPDSGEDELSTAGVTPHPKRRRAGAAAVSKDENAGPPATNGDDPAKKKRGRPSKRDRLAHAEVQNGTAPSEETSAITQTAQRSRRLAGRETATRESSQAAYQGADGAAVQKDQPARKPGRPRKVANVSLEEDGRVPKGILTPRKGKVGVDRLRKSVAFNNQPDEDALEELEAQTPSKSARKRRQTSPEEAEDELNADGKSKTEKQASDKGSGSENEDEDDEVCALCSKPDSEPPNEIVFCDNCDMAVHQECYGLSEIPEGDWICRSCSQDDASAVNGLRAELVKSSVFARDDQKPDIPNFEQHLRSAQRVLLDRCAGRRRIKLRGQDEAYEKAYQLVEQTVVAGEGNSMMVIGARGCGKTTLVESIITDISRKHKDQFHVVRLSGFIHTDDKLALREIWRQLGKEMEIEDELVSKTTNYADTMASLLALLSHPSEIAEIHEGVTSRSVVFVIDEFDLFATHARQTLLYNLFDIAQARKAPIAVLGLTTRIDVVESLEKRVKSRFSHRYVYLSLPRSLPAYWDLCQQGLTVDEEDMVLEGIDHDLEGHQAFWDWWNGKIEALYKTQAFKDHLESHFYSTKSVPAFLTSCILPLAMLSPALPFLQVPSNSALAVSLEPPDSKLHLLGSLSDLDLSMLISAARLDIVAHTDTVNFAMAYDEYTSLMGKQRVQSASSGMLALGGGARVWGRGTAGIAWERLVALGLLVPAAAGGRGTAGLGGLDAKMWKVDVALEEIPAAVKLNAVLARWCREI
ncbi:hypothetical protein VTI74DRAFT_6013 [Chaetomium olivicolor]